MTLRRGLRCDCADPDGGHGPRTPPRARRTAAIAAFAVALTLTTASALGATPSATPPAPGLSLSSTSSPVGYVSVRVIAPAGSVVTVGERSGAAVHVLRRVTVGTTGTATLSRLLTWRCDIRARSLVATLTPAAGAPVTAGLAVHTPDCRHRVVVALPRRAVVSGATAVRARDAWGIGNLRATLCITPPGGYHACRPVRFRRGQRRVVVTLRPPRPGGWRLSLSTTYHEVRRSELWVSHRNHLLRLLAAGDSEMQLLDDMLGGALYGRGVRVTDDARISTGLTNSFFFNWPQYARGQAPTLRPDVTVFFLGGNEGFSVSLNRHQVACCGGAWSRGYAALVAQLMRSYLRGNAGRVYWFTLPTPAAGNWRYVFNGVNRGIREAAAEFPGRVRLIDANHIFTPGNRYRDYMTYQGQGFVIHEPDGIHLSVAADRVAASYLIRQLRADRVIH